MLLSEIGGDRAVRRINMAPLKAKFTPNLERLVQIIKSYGFKVRIVGGAVRDVLIGRAPRDIDMITDALPVAVMYILGKHDIRFTVKGIPHGTVQINFPGDEEYELTSLGYEVSDECCPKSVVIHSGESWEGDANRRDFTIDTLSVTLDGLLYDYVNGFNDLRAQNVKFLGSPAERIQKDPVLIMRFFRLLSLFRDPKYDKSLLPLIKMKMKLVKRIKKKRMDRELDNIAKGPNAEKVRKLMTALGFDEIFKEIKECQLILEYQNPNDLVPALKVMISGQEHLLIGQRGETHADIWMRHENEIPKGAELDSGFYDKDGKKYLNRQQAQQLVFSSTRDYIPRSMGLTSERLRDIGEGKIRQAYG